MLLGDLTRLVGDRLRPPRPGIRLSIGDMGLVPRTLAALVMLDTERPSTGEREWCGPGPGDTASHEDSESGSRRPGCSPCHVSSFASAVRLVRAFTEPGACPGVPGPRATCSPVLSWGQAAPPCSVSVTLEMRSARVKPGREVARPGCSWERLYSRLEGPGLWPPVRWRGLGSPLLRSGWDRWAWRPCREWAGLVRAEPTGPGCLRAGSAECRGPGEERQGDTGDSGDSGPRDRRPGPGARCAPRPGLRLGGSGDSSADTRLSWIVVSKYCSYKTCIE